MMIAHELGHIMYEHGKKSIDTLTAQVEADRFAISLGYGEELEQFLLAQPESIEMRTRLAYLTSQVIISEYKK
jgi:predicted Zn-dependent protease